MAFNNIGHNWLANGASMWVTIRISHDNNGIGTDAGAQWIMANPLPFDTFPTPDGTTQLESGRFQKRFEYANGGTDWTYNCLVENTAFPGWNATFFTLSGGGNA